MRKPWQIPEHQKVFELLPVKRKLKGAKEVDRIMTNCAFNISGYLPGDQLNRASRFIGSFRSRDWRDSYLYKLISSQKLKAKKTR